MDIVSWIFLLLAILCFALVFFLVWLGPPTRHPDRQPPRKNRLLDYLN